MKLLISLAAALLAGGAQALPHFHEEPVIGLTANQLDANGQLQPPVGESPTRATSAMPTSQRRAQARAIPLTGVPVLNFTALVQDLSTTPLNTSGILGSTKSEALRSTVASRRDIAGYPTFEELGQEILDPMTMAYLRPITPGMPGYFQKATDLGSLTSLVSSPDGQRVFRGNPPADTRENRLRLLTFMGANILSAFEELYDGSPLPALDAFSGTDPQSDTETLATFATTAARTILSADPQTPRVNWVRTFGFSIANDFAYRYYQTYDPIPEDKLDFTPEAQAFLNTAIGKAVVQKTGDPLGVESQINALEQALKTDPFATNYDPLQQINAPVSPTEVFALTLDILAAMAFRSYLEKSLGQQLPTYDQLPQIGFYV